MKGSDFFVPALCILAISTCAAYLMKRTEEQGEISFIKYQSYIYATNELSFHTNGTPLSYAMLSEAANEIEVTDPFLLIVLPANGCRSCEEMLLEELGRFFPNYRNDPHIVFAPLGFHLTTPDFGNTISQFDSVWFKGLFPSQEPSLSLFVCQNKSIQNAFIPNANYRDDLRHYLKLFQELSINLEASTCHQE